MTVFDIKALIIAFLNDPLKMKQDNFLRQIMIYLLGKQRRLPQQLTKSTAVHCGSQQDESIAEMIPTHLPVHWHVFMIRPMWMFLDHLHVHHSFAYQHS